MGSSISISMQASSKRGQGVLCKSSSIPYTILFGLRRYVGSLVADTGLGSDLWRILAVVMSFGNIALAYLFTNILIEIQGKINTSPPPESKVMQKAMCHQKSGICIGDPREAAPAGGSHSSSARAGDDCSPPPHECDWSRFMGSAVINRDGSCTISATVMCMEAQYKRLNENNHGPNYVLKVTAEAVESLKDLCEKGGAWNPNDGGQSEDAFEVIRSWELGLPTVISPAYQPWYKVILSQQNIMARLISRRNHLLNRAGPSIRLKSYEIIMDDELSPLKITSMLHKMGPLVGVLYADDEAYDSSTSTVYRGNRDFPGNHVVVCTGYYYVHDELCIVIMDNYTCEGPVRLVMYEAFEEFHVLTVDAS